MGSTESRLTNNNQNVPDSNSNQLQATNNEWTTSTIVNGQIHTQKGKNKDNKKNKKNKVDKKKSDKELVAFFKNDRRFISFPSEENKNNDNTENKQEEKEATVRLMAYNILADGYAQGAHHNYCPSKYREWDYRFKRILMQFEAYKPDIVCIQEATPSSWQKKMEKPLKKYGYVGIHVARDEFEAKFGGNAHSECLIYKKKSFKLIKYKIMRLCDYVGNKNNKYYDEIMGSNKSMYRSYLSSCKDVVIIAHFECNKTKKQFVVCSSHLFWDPRKPEIKSSQAMIFNHELEELFKTDEWKWKSEENKNDDVDINEIPIIFGVDSNCLPFKEKSDEFDENVPRAGSSSGGYELFCNGTLTKEHIHHPYAKINFRENEYQKKQINSEGNIKMSKKECEYIGEMKDWKIDIKWNSVYSVVNKRNENKEPIFTNRVAKFTGTLDYIFITNKCKIKSWLEMPWQKELTYHLLKENENNNDDDEWIEKELKKEEILCNQFPFIPNIDYPSDHLPMCADIIIQ